MTSGYSGTPLGKKLGLKEGMKIRLAYAPGHYFDLFTDMPQRLEWMKDKKPKKNLIHYFTTELNDLLKDMSALKEEIETDGIIWISWPKKSAKIQTNITENDIRDIALKNGLVDIKVCAVDDVWSALKLVIPVKERKGKIL